MVPKVGQCVELQGFTARLANQTYAPPGHVHELTLNDNGLIKEVPNLPALPTLVSNYLPLNEVVSCPDGQIVDMIGLLSSDSGVCAYERDGRQGSRRVLKIGDATGDELAVTIWGSDAVSF